MYIRPICPRSSNFNFKAIFLFDRRFIRFIIHYENYDTQAGWTMESDARLSGSNAALPWIVFGRDRNKLEKEMITLKAQCILTHWQDRIFDVITLIYYLYI